MSPPANRPTPEAVRDRAVEWRVRLSSDAATEADWLAFETWLAADPAHGRAYDAVEALWLELDDVPSAPAKTNVAALRPRRRPPLRRAEIWIGAVAASLLLLVAVGLGFRGGQAEAYQTARGQRQVVALADGTRITLNGGSRISVKLGRRERQVVMADAEAVFDVAKDPSRPFVIEAGDRQVRVVGTEFDVLRRSGEVQVTVRRGIVEVRPVKTAGGPPIARLHPGQSLSHREGAAADQVGRADPEAAFAWTQGRLIFRNERLVDAAIVLNRYLETPIVVDPQAQDLRVTAVLTLGSDAAMLQTLSDFLPIRAERHGKVVRVSLKQAAR